MSDLQQAKEEFAAKMNTIKVDFNRRVKMHDDSIGIWDVSTFDEEFFPDITNNKEALDKLMAQFYNQVMLDYMNKFHAFMGITTTPQKVFQAVYSGALAQLCATIATDIGMSKEHFVGLAAESYDAAYGNAPKFG